MANEQNTEESLTGAMATAFAALGWTLTDARRADRLLALTGLSPAALRERIENPSVLAAVLEFLEAHEPDLVACATALCVDPAELVRARMTLEAQS